MTHHDLDKEAVMSRLRKIPGMNELAATALYIYGIRSVEELIGKNADEIYLEMSKRHDIPADTCTLMINALRVAVRYANTKIGMRPETRPETGEGAKTATYPPTRE